MGRTPWAKCGSFPIQASEEASEAMALTQTRSRALGDPGQGQPADFEGRMIAEAVRCLDEGVVSRPEEVDLAMVMGIGWPPFLGGLLRHADDTGLANVVEELERLAGKHGRHLAPPPRLGEMARLGKRFYVAL